MKKKFDLMALFDDHSFFNFSFKIGNNFFLAGKICDLTAFVSPSARARFGEIRIDFDYGLTVIPDGCKNNIFQLQENLAEGKYLALPKTIPSKHSFDMLVSTTGLSPWLIAEISGIFERYCLNSTEALELINSGHDKLIENLRSVYVENFDYLIKGPLFDIDSNKLRKLR